MNYILASASPRRKELLKQIGLDFAILPACGEEHTSFTVPQEAVMDLSRQKAEEAAKQRKEKAQEEVIIGADTVVSLADMILGKPKDRQDAIRMLSALSGKSHKVFTGVTFVIFREGKKTVHSFYEETEVTMYPMSEEEINWYIGTDEPFDKAGGYGIQGRCAIFIKEIRGDYNNVVGLPVARIYQEFMKLGIDIYEKK